MTNQRTRNEREGNLYESAKHSLCRPFVQARAKSGWGHGENPTYMPQVSKPLC